MILGVVRARLRAAVSVPLFALAILVAAVMPVVAGATVRPRVLATAAASGTSFYDLGVASATNAAWNLTNDDQVGLTSGWWHNGVLTPPPTLPGSSGPMQIEGITQTGLLVGTAPGAAPYGRDALAGWRPSSGSPAQLFPPECTLNDDRGPTPYYADGVAAASNTDEVASAPNSFCGVNAFNSVNVSVSLVNPTFTIFSQVYNVEALRQNWYVGGRATNDEVIVNRITGEVRVLPVTLGLDTRALAADGTVVGDTTANVGESVSPDGAQVPLPLLPGFAFAGPNAISDTKDVVAGIVGNSTTSSTGQRLVIWPSPTSTPVDITSALPQGWTPNYPLAVNDSGHVVGIGTAPDGKLHVFFLAPGSAHHVSGTVLRGTGVNVPVKPARAVAGVDVKVQGTSEAGRAVSVGAVTGRNGGYDLSVPDGHYTVVFPAGVCVVGPAACASARLVTVKGSDVVVNALAIASTLDVRVSLSKPKLRLKLKGEDLAPQTIVVKVKVKNTGRRRVDAVTLQKPLFAAVGGAKIAAIPLKVLKGPSPAGGRNLTPGQTIDSTYALHVRGDGIYDVSVLAIGGIPGIGRVAGLGSARLKVTAPLLVMTSEIGRRVRSPDAFQLIRAGTVFTVKLKLKNLSYFHTLGVYPLKPGLDGNASDGHVETAGFAIQNPSLNAPPRPSEAVVLIPRQMHEMEIVVRTTATYADVQSPELPGGGTRAVVHIPGEPRVADLADDESVQGEVAAKDIRVLGAKAYEVGIDDRDFRDPPPESNWPATTAYFAAGAFQGVWNLTGGVVVAVFKDLPLLLAKGIIGVPSAVLAYAKLEAELWDSIKNDPAKKALFLTGVGNLALLAYRHAPALAGNVAEFYKRVDQQVLAHYTRLANDESSGNYYAAVQEYGREGTEITGNLVLASGLLTRFPAAITALNELKQASYVKVGEALNAIADGVGGTEALAALKQVTPGYEFLTRDLRKFYGLSENQTAWLRGFAQRNRLIITLRSRAEESLKWLADGAVLKPEQLKIKTVSIDDINYLGYREGDLGRVVIRKPPTNAELQQSLRAKGLGPQDPEWATALRRLSDRTTEYNHPGYDQGYVRYLETQAAKGKITLRWNLSANSVDSSVLANGYTEYGFQLLDEGGGNNVVQFFVDGQWRSVTGDVDFLSIVHADGSPLSALERVAVYRQMAKSPVGMLHPAADTWTLIKRGNQQIFDFSVKTNEFVRGGTAAQIGPDGVARAVVFNPASRFTGPTTYRIFWNGGYTNVKRLLFR